MTLFIILCLVVFITATVVRHRCEEYFGDKYENRQK